MGSRKKLAKKKLREKGIRKDVNSGKGGRPTTGRKYLKDYARRVKSGEEL